MRVFQARLGCLAGALCPTSLLYLVTCIVAQQGKLPFEILNISHLANNLDELLQRGANGFLLQETSTKGYHLAEIHASCKAKRYRATLGRTAAGTSKAPGGIGGIRD